MKKKYELIKHAYDNYPKGTVFTSIKSGTEYISTGTFELSNISRNVYCILEGGYGERKVCVYSYLDGWAEIVKPSILDGKVAIQVDNEREFKLLMEHYEGKGWRWNEYDKPGEYNPNRQFPYGITYSDRFLVGDYNTSTYIKLIPFSDFAKEVGIEVPKFIMKSEDGVDLYEEEKKCVLDREIVAIHIENQRQFDLLMAHFKEKGWVSSFAGDWVKLPYRLYHQINSGFDKDYEYFNDYTIIPFSTFAKEVGIHESKYTKLLTTEDGVDLYEGDSYHEANINEGEWRYLHGSNHFIVPDVRPVTIPNESKAFSTREAAKAWIAEQNKPKEVVIDTVNYTVTVSSNEVLYVSKHDCKKQLFFGKELEEIYTAYKSLQ